jgi:hypothetical protein
MSISSLPMIHKVGIQLVGISGKAGSGKDVVATYLRNQYEDTYIYPFASQLKLAASILFGIPVEHFHQRDIKELVNPYWGVSPRKIAQYFGTESVRINFQNLLGESENFWIKRLNDHINGELLYYNDSGERTGDIETGDTIVVPDVRFQNEYDWILANGGIVIQLVRQGADGNVGIAGHASEVGYTSIDNERTFVCVNDGTLDDLYAKIDAIMKTTEPTAESMEL